MKNNIIYTERVDKGAIAVYSTAAGVLTSDYNVVVDQHQRTSRARSRRRTFGYDTHSLISTATALS